MKFQLITLLFMVSYINALTSPEDEKEWHKFLKHFKPQYNNSEEFKLRKSIFIENLKEFRKHNEEYKRGLHTYTIGVNQFADKTDEELRSVSEGMLDFELSDSIAGIQEDPIVSNPNTTVPKSVDWRKRGAVTPVKRQGHCGACWAFSAIGSIEGQYFLATNKSIVFSEQQLVDCSKRNHNCHGGLMHRAFNDLREIGGVALDKTYPYTAKKGDCVFNKKMSAAKVLGYKFIQENNEQALKQAVALYGPIAVGVHTTRRFKRYTGGIYYDYGQIKDVRHAILVIGYGSKNGIDYWIVKNSWGVEWGQNGFGQIVRNRNNNCMIASYATFPLVIPA